MTVLASSTFHAAPQTLLTVPDSIEPQSLWSPAISMKSIEQYDPL